MKSIGSFAKDSLVNDDCADVSRSAIENTASLASIFDQQIDRVFGFLYVRCGSRSLAEDLAAETFSAASLLFAEGRGSDVTRSWLLTVARRRLIDHWRTESTRKKGLTLLRNSSLNRHEVDPLLETVVDQALDSLSPRYRAVLTLRYLEGFAVDEVATALGLSYKATESLLTRARKSFAAAYGDST